MHQKNRYAFVFEYFPYPRDKSGVTLYDYEMLINAPTDICIDVYMLYDSCEQEYVNELRKKIKCDVNFIFLSYTKNRFTFYLHTLSRALFGYLGISCRIGYKIKQITTERYNAVYMSPMLSSFSTMSDIPVFLNAVDSFSKYNYRLYNASKKVSSYIKFFLYTYYEKYLLKSSKIVSFVSFDDLEFVRTNLYDYFKHKMIISPLGVDSSSFKKNLEVFGNKPCSLLFLGNFNYEPNVDAAKYLALEIFPLVKECLPHATLTIVGSRPPVEITNLEGVICTGYVDDVKSYYWSASVFICPLRLGAGTKNKILEAMASNLPIVSTSVGVEGILGVIDGVHYIEANNTDEIVKSTILLLTDNLISERIALNSRALIEGSFSWTPIISDVFKNLEKISLR